MRRSGGPDRLEREAAVEDREILDCIHALAAEQHRLRQSEEHSQEDEQPRQERLRQLEESLAQLWDLLRRCRAEQAESSKPGPIDLRDSVQA
jgi:spore cortex formation protein SpoVR/YcgB (stage V sporulation)